jgi:hypothetical protein
VVSVYDLARHRTVDLSTVGRRTGTWRRIEIWWFLFEDRLIITGTPGPRDWLANLRADSRLVIHTREGDFAGRANEIVDDEFRRRFFEHGPARWYSSQSAFADLVENAPMVEVRLD